jgi:hypothetical protein
VSRAFDVGPLADHDPVDAVDTDFSFEGVGGDAVFEGQESDAVQGVGLPKLEQDFVKLPGADFVKLFWPNFMEESLCTGQ